VEERYFQIFSCSQGPYRTVQHSAQGPVTSILCPGEILTGRTGAPLGYIIIWERGDRGTTIMPKWRWWERLPGEVLELGEDIQAEELMLVSEVNYFPVFFNPARSELKLMKVDLKLQHTAKTQY
jgi:hypothetical protein